MSSPRAALDAADAAMCRVPHEGRSPSPDGMAGLAGQSHGRWEFGKSRPTVQTCAHTASTAYLFMSRPPRGWHSPTYVGGDFAEPTRGCLPHSIAEKGLSLGGSDGGVSGSRFFLPRSGCRPPRGRGRHWTSRAPRCPRRGRGQPRGRCGAARGRSAGMRVPCPQARRGHLLQTTHAFQAGS